MLGVALSLLMACGNGQGDADKASVKVKIKTEQVGQAVTPGCEWHYVGQIESGLSTSVSFTGMGTLAHIYVEEGQLVRKGQLLAEMDKMQAESQLKAAEAQAEQARDAYQRMKQLYEQQSISEIKWVETQSTLQQAEAQLKSAQKMLADCTLYAPVGGYIGSKSMEGGETVLPALPVVSILSLQEVKAKISVPEKEVVRITAGTTSLVTVEALGGATFQGQRIEKGVEADAATHAYEVKIYLPNSERQLLPGMVCDVTLRVQPTEATKAIEVPLTAVHSRADDSRFVWVVQAGKATRQTVKTGSTRGDRIGIVSGLTEGSKLIIAGHQKLSEGSEVIE